MLESTIYSLGSPPAFSKTPADSDYWQARFAYEKSMNLYLLSQEGFEYQQITTTDLDTSETALDTWLSSSYAAWETDAIEKRKDGLPVPAPPSLPDMSDFQGQAGLANFLAKLNLRVNLTLFRFSGEPGGDPSEVVTELQNLRSSLETALLFVEDSTKKSILERAYLTENATGDIISMLWLIQARAIEVWLGSSGDIENVSLVASQTS